MKLLYLHGRPSAHPAHAAFAKALNADFRYIDIPLLWQDRSYFIFISFFFIFINSLFIPSGYDVYLIDNLHFSPILNKKIFFWRKKKYIVHLGSHTLYFMRSGLFSNFNTKLHKAALRNYDGAMCEGTMEKEFLDGLLDDGKKPLCKVTFLGPERQRQERLLKVEYNPSSSNLLIISSASNNFRVHYKGIDVMLDAFKLVKKKLPGITITIIGQVYAEFKNKYADAGGIVFTDYLEDIVPLLEDVGLGIHVSRGDAFPTSTLELMSAGIPVFVSDVTGTKEVVGKVSNEFIIPVNDDILAEKIYWFMNMEKEMKLELSEKFRKAASCYTMDKAIGNYVQQFNDLYKEIN